MLDFKAMEEMESNTLFGYFGKISRSTCRGVNWLEQDIRAIHSVNLRVSVHQRSKGWRDSMMLFSRCSGCECGWSEIERYVPRVYHDNPR